MNRHFFSIQHIVKQLFTAGLFALVSLPLFANKNKQPLEAANQAQPALQVIRSNDNEIILSIQYISQHPVKFDVVVRDEAGNLLYRKNYESSNFSKQFKLVNEPDASSQQLFVAIEAGDGKKYNYTVKSTVDIVKEVQVTRQ